MESLQGQKMNTLKKKLKKLLQDVLASSEVPDIIKMDAQSDLDYLKRDAFQEYDLEDMIDFYIYIMEKETNQSIHNRAYFG